MSEQPPKRYSLNQELSRLMTLVNRATHIADEWRNETLCSNLVAYGGDPDLWFRPEDTHEAASAASLCFSCPVRKECLEWACETKQREGIWGGLPPSVRLKKGDRPHDYESLSDRENPYHTANTRSPLHQTRLRDYDPSEEDDE